MGSRWLCCALACGLALDAGCGRIGFGGVAERTDAAAIDGDGGDAGPAGFGPWSAPVHLTQFASNDEDWEPALDATGLVLVFVRGGATDSNLWVATRPSVTADFGTASPIRGASSAALELGAAWSGDNARLYFRSITASTDEARYLSNLGGGTFSTTSQPASELPVEGFGWVFSRDGREVFYTTSPASNEYDLRHASRPNLGVGFSIDDAPISALQRPVGVEGWPTLDSTQNILYFERADAAGTAIYQATRSGPGASFGDLALVTYDAATDGDPEVSRDGRTLIFASTRANPGGDNDLFLMTRDPL